MFELVCCMSVASLFRKLFWLSCKPCKFVATLVVVALCGTYCGGSVAVTGGTTFRAVWACCSIFYRFTFRLF